MTDERMTPEQGLVAQAAAMGAEVAANVEDRALAARIMRETMAAFDEGMRKGAAARAAEADEPEPEGLIVGTIRTIGPDDARARANRWID